MTDALRAEALELGGKLARSEAEGSFTFRIEDEGLAVHVADGSVRLEDAPADVTFIAPLEIFRSIVDGKLSATAAYMDGQLRIEGDVAVAMQLGQLFG